MADSNPPATQPATAAATTPTTTTTASTAAKPAAAKPQNPALRMMGLPRLPKKLPSRNWMIFWTITGAFTAAIVYDKREKNRATAKWRRAVAPLAQETLSSANQLPRKLTIFLEAPPGDGLRVAQNHFIEYAKPVLAASGLDWEFVQGRQQGDVRAAVAEKIRRARRARERPGEELASTDESAVENLRKRLNLPEYQGTKGDIVLGLHTWKEYIRGLHEGWLGPLDAPPLPVAEVKSLTTEEPVPRDGDGDNKQGDEPKKEGEEEKKKEEKPERPPQPPPYNSIADYASASLPTTFPDEFDPSTTIPFPHRLGFRHTFVRLGRFLNRRKLADNIGRDVAAVCFAASREWREADGQYEQQLVLRSEEDDWPRSVFKEEETASSDSTAAAPVTGEDKPAAEPPKELIWAKPMVLDERIAMRMRRFEVQPEVEARAAQIVVPEEEVEGWIKGSLRSVWRWGASSWNAKPMQPNVGNVDDE